MEKVLTAILNHLDLLTIHGKDAERMAAIKSMVRDLIKACQAAGAKESDDNE